MAENIDNLWEHHKTTFNFSILTDLFQNLNDNCLLLFPRDPVVDVGEDVDTDLAAGLELGLGVGQGDSHQATES